jgi:predicted ATPase
MLVVLDSCEHVIEAVASLAERIAHGAPGIHILATSREPLGVGDELVYQLQPLPAPAEGATLDPSEIFAFPAVTLFLERVSAGGTAVGSSPRETQLLADIARKLEGIPLAIELTASRVQAFGLAGTAELLNERLHAVVDGRRTALPRHQTLGATLDWSYNLLPEVERKHLNRLAVFVGAFSMEAARSVADYEGEEGVEESVAQLVAKSLLTVDLSGPEARYRLLDTTRAYLAEKLRDSGEEAEAARRHAHCYFRSVEQKNAQRRAAGGVTRLVLTDDELGNIRAALQWSFGRPEGAAIAIPLAAAAVTFLVEMSLMAECRHWTERALAVLGEDSGTRRELDLQMVFANAVMFTEAGNPLVKVALERALELARALDQSIDELRILGALHLFHVRGAEHRRALKLAEAALQVAQRLDSPAALAAAEACVGMSNHLMGNHDAAPARLRSVLARTGTWPATIRFGMDYRIPAQMTLARHHWIEGKGDQAAALAQGTIERAEQLAHPVTHCVSLVLGIKVFLWLGDYDRAEAYIFDLITQAERRSLAPYDTIGRGLEGELNVRTGRSKAGIRLIEDTWAKLQAVNYRLMNTNLKLALAEGLAASGHVEDALGIVEKTAAAVEASGDLFQMPELLRLRGCLLERLGKAADGEVSLREALRWAERQCALAWRLRSATSLAAVAAGHGRLDEARHVLAPVYEKFTEGFGSIDLRAASTLLERLEIAA